jgi:hypothetical protein
MKAELMSDRSNFIVGLLGMTATVLVIPASVAVVRDSLKGRQAIAVLRVPQTFEIRNSQILDSAMYYRKEGAPDKPKQGLQLVAVLSGRAEADAVLGLWHSLRGESLIRRAGMSVLLCGVGEERVLDTMTRDVTVNQVRNPEDFSTRTGIRVLPFSLVIAGGDNVLAAGPGLPDPLFIRDAAERFIRHGPSAATTFRPVTLQMNSGIIGIEALFPSRLPGR